MTRLRFIALLAILLAVLAAGCARPVAQRPRTRPPAAEPTSTPATTTPVQPETEVPLTPPAGTTIALRVYFGLGEKVQPVRRTVPSTQAVLRAALEQLLAGPSAAERKAGLSTQIPVGTRLLGVTIRSRVAIVDLTGRFAAGGGTSSMTGRLAQVVYTATQFSGVDAVTFRMDGEPVEVFGGEGIVIDRPQTRADMEYATPAILVETPVWGGTVRGPFAARGTANVFEGDFELQVLGTGSKVLLERHVKASSGTGTRGTWSVGSKDALPAGPARLKVWVASAKDGTPQDVVVIPIVLGE